MQAPYAGNESGTDFITNYTHFFQDYEFHKTTNQGVSFTELTNIDGGVSGAEATFVRNIKRFWLEQATNNVNRVYAWEMNVKASAIYLRTSTTGITGTFSRRAMNGLTRDFTPRSSGGFPYNDDLFYAVMDNGIYATIDAGDEWLEKTGDLNLSLSPSVQIPNSAVGSMNFWPYVIVPLWVDA